MPWLLALLLLVASGWALFPGLEAGPSLDPAVFQVVGERLLSGDRLYADIWDHKPPGVYLLYAAAAVPGVDTWSFVWLLTVIADALAGVCVWYVVRGRVTAPIATVAAVACPVAASAYPISLGGGMSEALALPLVAGAMLVVALGGPGRWRGAVAGGLWAAGVAVSVQVIVAGPALLLLAGLKSGRTAIGLLGGVVGVAAIGAGMLAAGGSLPGAFDALVAYAGAYRAALAEAPNVDSALSVQAALVVLAALWIPAVGGAVFASVRSMRGAWIDHHVEAASIAWILCGVATAAAQGRYYAHYAIAIAPPLALLAAVGAEQLLAARRPPLVRAAAAGALVVLLVISATAASNGTGPYVAAQAGQRGRLEAVAARLREVAEPGDRLFVWGDAPALHSLSGMPPATRYPYLLPLTTPGYATPALIADLADDWRHDPPMYVVDAGSATVGDPGRPPLLEARPVISDDGRDFDALEPLRSLVRERYLPLGLWHGWPVYQLRN